MVPSREPSIVNTPVTNQQGEATMEVKWPVSQSVRPLEPDGPSWEAMQEVRNGKSVVCMSVRLHYNNRQPSKQ